MKTTFEFEGLKELQRQLERLVDDAELKAVNKKIYQRCAEITKPKMQSHIPKSLENSKSGRLGYRPPGHAKDNIPITITAKGATIGWSLLGDAENWFYMKFVEWGTSKQPPQEFLDITMKECDYQYSQIAKEEYEALISAKIGD